MITSLAHLIPSHLRTGGGGSFPAYLTADPLHWQEHEHGQPVEHVVYGGSRESSTELVPVIHLAYGDDGVGHGCTYVGPHDDEDGGPDW